MTNLHRCVQRADNGTACVNAVVDYRQTVEHGFAFTCRFLDAHFCFLVSVLSGVAVDGCWQQVRAAFILQVSQQVDVFLYQRNAGSWLYQCLAFFFGFV